MRMNDAADHIEKKYFTIGEVADALKVPTSMIRFWEKEFPQLKPRKTDGGIRKYDAQDLELLKRIYQLVKVEGFTLAGAREKLKERNTSDIEQVKVKLTSLRNFLLELKEQLK